jgi:hypothetical protein
VGIVAPLHKVCLKNKLQNLISFFRFELKMTPELHG